MTSLIDYIKKNYSFLLDQNFEIKNIIDNGNLFSTANLTGKSGLIFSFTLEKGEISLAISNQTILQNKKIVKYDKYYDMFYVTKLLDPKIDFSEITEKIYPNLIKKNIETLTSFLNDENLDKTLKAINKIAKDYDKIRWNKPSLNKN
jgi:hypothetical protein